MKLVGEKAIGPFLIELEKDALKMSKIKECCDKAVITVKVSSKKERPTTAPAKVTTTTKSTVIKAPKSAPASKIGAAKKKSTAPATTGIVKSKSGKSLNAKQIAKPVERELSDEEVDEIVGSILSATIVNDLSNANWKTRLAAAEQFMVDIQDLDTIPAQALIKIIARRPGLKDTNFQVLKVKLDIVKFIAKNSTSFSTTTANCCLNDIAEKFGDAKNGTSVCDTMSTIAETISLNFVTENIIEFAFNQKNPKVIQETLLWLSNAIKEFGFA